MGFIHTSLVVMVTSVLISVLPGYLKTKLPVNVGGSVSPGWEKVEEVFRTQVETGEQQGGSFAVYYKGEKVVNLMGGYADADAQIPWTEKTINQFFSSTKGVSALAIALLVDRGLLNYKRPVKDYWPEFAANGKEKITVEQLFSHQAGLYTIDAEFQLDDVMGNTQKYHQVLAEQKPLWVPGSQAGYHSITIGYYEDLVVQKVDPKHRTLAQFFKEEIANPLELDFQIGLRYEDNWRSTRVQKQGISSRLVEVIKHPWIAKFMYGILNSNSLIWKTVVPKNAVGVTMNNPEYKKYPIGSVNGFGDASSIAKLYGVIANGGTYKGKRLFSEKTIAMLDEKIIEGQDAVLGLDVIYGRGFLLLPNKKNDGFTFGTPGAGGQMAYGDLKNKLGWTYLSNYHMTSLQTDTYKALWEVMYDVIHDLEK